MYKSMLALVLLIALAACGQPGEGDKESKEAIRSKAEEYVKAYNKHDTQLLASMWAEDAFHINPRTGDVARGREEIRKQFEEFFKEHGDVRIAVAIKSIDFPEENEAVEQGMATVTAAGKEPQQLAYKAFYKKIDGQWLLTQVREVDVEEAVTNYEQIQELEWLIGDWMDADEDVNIATATTWYKNKSFIVQKFTVAAEGHEELEGFQVIGWDPKEEKVRSWLFDSDGGFGQGAWTKKGTSWIIDITQELSDGTLASATNILTPLDKDSYTWSSTDRQVGGEILPDIEPVTVVRTTR